VRRGDFSSLGCQRYKEGKAGKERKGKKEGSKSKGRNSTPPLALYFEESWEEERTDATSWFLAPSSHLLYHQSTKEKLPSGGPFVH
jgi:hypothetical protein